MLGRIAVDAGVTDIRMLGATPQIVEFPSGSVGVNVEPQPAASV